MGKQSELIITKGQEFKIVVKDSIKEDDVFIDQYEQAAGMLNTIVAESIAAGERAEKSVKALYSLNEYENRENEKERLIIAIDDLDLCNSNAYKMAEQIRKYLIIPQIIIIMAVKIEQLELCVEENTIAEFKGVVSTEKRQAEEKQNRIGVEIQGMSERYVAKLIPKARRIYLPKAQSIEDIRVIYKEKDTEEKKETVIWESETNENLVKAVLDLIRERTGMIFLPEKSGMSYLLPDNLRDMVNWIVFVADMKKVCIPQKEDESKKDLDDAKIQEICLKNIKKFVQYFNGEWITRQMPDSFGRELRLMEKMDNLHMNLNANWFLKKLYMSTDKKENEKNDNDISKKVGAYWKNIQWFIWFKDNIYDMDIERKSYGLKVLYTAKLNQWIREGNNIMIIKIKRRV